MRPASSIAVALAVLLLCATASAVHFVGLGDQCSATALCKNYLLCSETRHVCVDIPQVGDNCTLVGVEDPCAPNANSYLACINGHCQAALLNNGDKCVDPHQCLSGLCQFASNNVTNATGTAGGLNASFPVAMLGGKKASSSSVGVCVGASLPGDTCDLFAYAWNCPKGYTCLLNGTGTSVTTCQKPLPLGADCTANYELFSLAGYPATIPQGMCAPGSMCIAVSASQRNCTALFSGQAGDVCFPANGISVGTPFAISLNCNYNLTCQPNATSGLSHCTAYPKAKHAKNCSLAMPMGAGQCAFGYSCALNSSSVGTCTEYIGGAECLELLSDYTTCLKTKKCDVRPFDLPNPYTMFAGLANPASCTGCYKMWQAFMCCQNSGFTVKGPKGNTTASVALTDVRYPYTPARTPTGLCKVKHTLPNWVVPVCVLAGIVVFITLITLIYILLPVDRSAAGYQTLVNN